MNPRIIDDIQTGEIINYLRDNRGCHILVNMTKEMYSAEFGEKFSDIDWTDFVTFCYQLDNDLMYKRAEKYLGQWHTICIIRNSFNEE